MSSRKEELHSRIDPEKKLSEQEKASLRLNELLDDREKFSIADFIEEFENHIHPEKREFLNILKEREVVRTPILRPVTYSIKN